LREMGNAISKLVGKKWIVMSSIYSERDNGRDIVYFPQIINPFDEIKHQTMVKRTAESIYVEQSVKCLDTAAYLQQKNFR